MTDIIERAIYAVETWDRTGYGRDSACELVDELADELKSARETLAVVRLLAEAWADPEIVDQIIQLIESTDNA